MFFCGGFRFILLAAAGDLRGVVPVTYVDGRDYYILECRHPHTSSCWRMAWQRLSVWSLCFFFLYFAAGGLGEVVDQGGGGAGRQDTYEQRLPQGGLAGNTLKVGSLFV